MRWLIHPTGSKIQRSPAKSEGYKRGRNVQGCQNRQENSKEGVEEDDYKAHIWYASYHPPTRTPGTRASINVLLSSRTRFHPPTRKIRALHTANGITVQEGTCHASRIEGYCPTAHNIREEGMSVQVSASDAAQKTSNS